MTLYGGLLFVGLFLGLLFIMAMILIIYYKQITEGYEDRERYRIMRKVGLSRREIRRSISSQILIVFFLPLAAAGAARSLRLSRHRHHVPRTQHDQRHADRRLCAGQLCGLRSALWRCVPAHGPRVLPHRQRMR